ncbi:MAG: protein kinase domain-containing protein [Pseudanabaena sp.]
MTMLGKTLTGRYTIIKQLGGGGFSQTFIAEDGYLPDRPQCVIKQLKPASSQAEVLEISRKLFDKEAKVLYRLGKHECIPSLLAHFEEDEEFFLAQELIEGEVLTKEIKKGICLGEQYTINFLTDILLTLDFVHRQQVIHRDIKPSNLIRRTSDRKIVLIDFGAVKEVSTQPISQLGHTSSLVIGSPGYMPNEQYSGKTMFASDIYAIGIIAVQTLTGLLPNQIPEDPTTSEFRWRDHAKVTPTLADIIDKMVRFDFRQRYQSANEVLVALQPLLTESLAHTIFRAVTPSSLDDLSLAPDNSDLQSSTINKIAKTPLELLIDDISDDLEMSEDPFRAKKLLCLVCTGILENEAQRLDNFSFVEILQDLYQQYPTEELLKENIINVVKTLAAPKQNQYLIVAKTVFNIVSQIYRLPTVESTASGSELVSSGQVENQPISYQVSNLVINAGSAQIIAPIESSPKNQSDLEEKLPDVDLNQNVPSSASQLKFTQDELSLLNPSDITENNANQDIYAWVAHDINTDAQQIRLEKLLFYTFRDVWESDPRQLNSIDWVSLLKELVIFAPTFPQMRDLIQEAVQRVSKPAEYTVIGNILLAKLEPLYPDSAYAHIAEVVVPPVSQANSSIALSVSYEPSKVPFDPQISKDLFDLRLELMRFTNSMRTKILLFSTLYYPFDPDRDNWQDLRSHELDGLLRQMFYAYPSLGKLEHTIWQVVRSLNESSAYEQSANYILQVIKTLYDQLVDKSMLHPAEDSLLTSRDTDSTHPSAIFRNG